MSEFNFSPDLSSDEGRVSYGIGRQLGGQLRDNPPPGVDLTAILAGLTDAFSGQASRVSEAELGASFKVIREIMQAEAAAKAEAAAGEGRAYLAENAKREGVTVLASGLQYEVLVAGEGAKPSAEDQVRTHYHGTLIDGTVFDSSYERGQPAPRASAASRRTVCWCLMSSCSTSCKRNRQADRRVGNAVFATIATTVDG